ncbi:MAG: DUF4070 domain-containing protein [Candidatus Marinimicrobia bacterium]|nr:DUF4070 domain-containing protein [Candidatus Neomarinimicrobiota bacterium]
MKILLINPKTPETFWSFSASLKFVSKKSSEIPLGLLTVAAMLPQNWSLRLIDENVSPLNDEDILWSDFVFSTAMSVHRHSLNKLIDRCKRLKRKIVAGGPLVTLEPENFAAIDHLILNEAEITLPLFLEDLLKGKAKKQYKTDTFPGIHETPVPRWDLLKMKDYATMNIQYSRGCPNDCEFCSVTMLNGRHCRTKTADQFLKELNFLYNLNWRGHVFIVDDNFIGNKHKLKQELLPALIQWSKARKYPFRFTTEASLDLADDELLMDMMIDAGFYSVFVGIETPNKLSLNECNKKQNLNRDISDSVKILQSKGFVVSAGFIVGFDNDNEEIFDDQIKLIQKSGIVTAMVGLLNAPVGTRLYQRLSQENRIVRQFTGDNVDGTTNLKPIMGLTLLKAGYEHILSSIYSPKEYYQRIRVFLNNYTVPNKVFQRVSFTELKALFKSFWFLGFKFKGRLYYWRLFFISLFKYPRKFPVAITLAIYGVHFQKITQNL